MTGIHFIRIVGDYFAPALRSGDRIMVTPISRYDYDGIYLLADGSIHRADRQASEVVLFGDNPVYDRHRVPLVWFNEQVRGKALASVKLHATEREFEERVRIARADGAAPALEVFA